MALVFVIDDDDRQSALYAGILESNGLEVETFSSADAARERLSKIRPGIIVSDVRMPGTDGLSFLRQVRETIPDLPFLLVTAFPEVQDAVKALKLGAVDYLEKPVDLDELAAAVMDALRIPHGKGVEPDIPKKLLKDIVVESDAIKVIMRDAYKVAMSEATVLITGPSGAGKEVVAQFIHRASPRADNKFLALNCAAIPKDILASELFGHKKGAFTGAIRDRKGIFREADGGTLFLDEIGDMPLELQPSLLRAIETGKISPVGGDLELKTDIRLIAATNKEIEGAVANGTFREDLFYRLNVVSIHIPPLSERPDDIIPLAKLFLAQKNIRDARFSRGAVEFMENYDWPGNARELANAVERAAILSNTDVILPEHLPPAVRRGPNERRSTADSENTSATAKTMKEAEIEAIKSALETTDGNRTKAAELLGISRRALIYKIKSYGLS